MDAPPNLSSRAPVIDSRNEQEFPTLGNGPSVPIRASIPLNTRAFGTKGLAKTKENFPALGGAAAPQPGVGSSYVAQTASSSASSSRASSLFKNVPKPANKAKAQEHASTNKSNAKPTLSKSVSDFPSLPGNSARSDMFETVRTTSKISTIVAKQPAKIQEKVSTLKHVPTLSRSVSDFPSLSLGGSSNGRRDLQSDFIETAPSYSMTSVSAKHRALVPSYESVGSGQSGSKINTIQRVEVTKSITAGNERAPTINSKANFPALGGGSAAAPAPLWVASGPPKAKKPLQVSKKLKVAPAPLLEQPTNGKVSTGNSDKPIKKEKIEEKPKPKPENSKENVAAECKKATKKEKKNAGKGEETTNAVSAKGKENTNKEKTKATETKGSEKKQRNENQTNNNHAKSDSESPLQNGFREHTDGGLFSNGNVFAALAAGLVPPPGFRDSEPKKPPPGFANTSSTNGTAPTYEYMPPSNATQRNQVGELRFFL